MRNRYFLVADLFLVVCAALLAFALRFDWLFFRNRPEVPLFVAAALVVKPLTFLVLGLYWRLWRYASIGDLIAIVIANSVASLVLSILVVTALATGAIVEFSRSVLLIDFLLTVTFTGGARFSERVLGESQGRYRKVREAGSTARHRMLIVGAGNAGAMVARECRRNPQLGLHVVGFLDDAVVKHGKRIAGVPVLGPVDSLEAVVPAHRIDQVVIAMPTAPGSAIRVLVETCRRLEVPSKILPGVYEILGDRITVRRLRDVEITDLLRREPVRHENPNLDYVADQVVLVTGAGGSIGSELCRQVAMARPRCLVLVGHGENSIFDIDAELRRAFPALDLRSVIADIRDGSRIRELFTEVRPAVVFHAAAHKHVPLMEANPEEAVTNNIIGTARLLHASVRAGADRFVLISSDKAVSPGNIMGASKRVAEQMVHLAARTHGRAFVVVRFGNVLGSRGSVVPIFKQQIERGGPLTITHPDVQRYFMTIPEAVQLVLQAGGLGRGGEVFVLNMGPLVKVVDLAHDLVRLSGLDPQEIPVVFTGLRPGEKLIEELWEDDAQVDATTNRDLFSVIERSRHEAQSAIAETFAAVATWDWPQPPLIGRLVDVCRQMIANGHAAGDGQDPSSRFPDART
ncbi:MAG TPA: nucleoside-diphosphate sugar epimerase/dehydratase [Vicinamibacterales bacterium]